MYHLLLVVDKTGWISNNSVNINSQKFVISDYDICNFAKTVILSYHQLADIWFYGFKYYEPELIDLYIHAKR